MTPEELVDGFIAGKRRVILAPFEDQPEARGEVLGYYGNLPDKANETDSEAVARYRQLVLDDCFFVVCVDQRYRDETDHDGLRDGVAPDQLAWDDAELISPTVIA